MTAAPTDLNVECRDPQLLDQTIQSLPGCAAAVVEGSWNGEACQVRVFSGLEFLKFALDHQGYGRVLGEEPVASEELAGKLMDFPTAWEIARATPVAEHDPRCSYAQASGGFLCDCHVLYQHPQYIADYGDQP